MRIISLNLNGLRSAANKGFIPWMQEQQADILCLQEIKAQEADLNDSLRQPDGYFAQFHCAEKKGYSGVAIFSRRQPDRVVVGMNHAEFDAEGRVLRFDFDQPTPLSVLSLYLPSGSSSDERQQAKFRFLEAFYSMLRELRQSGREVVLCGDWNIAHKEIDLKNWKGNLKNSGFLPEERAWLTQVFDELGWVDVYRKLHPETTGEAYTWWSNRGQAYANNVGWRIDYQIASPGMAARASSTSIYKTQRFSDHAPLIVDYDTAF